jgi:hypothetical protein
MARNTTAAQEAEAHQGWNKIGAVHHSGLPCDGASGKNRREGDKGDSSGAEPTSAWLMRARKAFMEREAAEEEAAARDD